MAGRNVRCGSGGGHAQNPVIKVDYTPLYDINPMTLAPNLAFGVNDTDQFTTITRTDGKPLRIVRLDASKPWITAKVEPGAKADDVTARTNFLRAWKLLPTGAKSEIG